MPVWKHCLILHDNCGEFTFKNETDYTPDLRTDKAEVLIAAHVDEQSIENFVTVDSTPYTSKLEYLINNTKDGHYHFELLRFPTFVPATIYDPETRDGNDIIITYADLVYYTNTQKFYKNIQSTSTVAPDDLTGAEYWEEITDFTDEEVRKNTNIEVGVFDDIHDCRARKCTKDELYKVTCKDPNCLDVKTLMPYLKKAVYLAGARAKNSDDQPEKAETILRIMDNQCKGC
jgi:hypothetical protein